MGDSMVNELGGDGYMTMDEKIYCIETLKQIRSRCEKNGWGGEVEAIDHAIKALEAQEVEDE